MAFYYLNESNQPVGPMDIPAIRKLSQAGIVAEDVLICAAGTEDWTPLSQAIEPAQEPSAPRPPRTAPPPRNAAWKSSIPVAQPAISQPSVDLSYPDWFPLASMLGGIAAILALCLPVLSIILAATALTLGILVLRQRSDEKKSFTVTGIISAAVALVASLGILVLGFGGNPKTKYVGSWQNDISIQIVHAQLDYSVMVTFHESGRFTEVSGAQTSGANYDTGHAMRAAGGQKTTGYWEWDRKQNALVTQHDGGNPTFYGDGDSNDGRGFRTGPTDMGQSTKKAGEEFWIFRPDPSDSNVLIGRHPTMYHNRTMKFYRLD